MSKPEPWRKPDPVTAPKQKRKRKPDPPEVVAARIELDIAITTQAEREARAIRGAFRPTRTHRRQVSPRRTET